MERADMENKKKDDDVMKGISEDQVKDIISGIDIEEIERKEIVSEGETKKTIQEDKKAYEEFLRQLDFLSNKFKLPHKVYEGIFEPDRILEIDIPLLLEKKSRGKDVIRVFTGYWVEHNSLFGPYLGEITLLPNLKAEEIKGLAAISNLKNVLLELPFGSAAGGISANQVLLNSKERERLARSYIKGMLRFLNFDKDIISAGSGVDEKSISFMYDECKKLEKSALKEHKKEEKKEKTEIIKKKEEEKKKDLKGNFLGKLFQDGGLRARNQAIASGIFIILDELLKEQEVSKLPGVEKHEDILKKSPREITLAIHGFNHIEQELAFILFDAGYKIVAISDSLGAIASAAGIDPRDAARWQKGHRSVAGLPKISRVKKEQFPEIRAEILILGSAANMLGKDGAKKIKANIVIELEDLLTLEASAVLGDMGKTVLPYIISSCSIRMVNYLEWLQNRENKFFSQKEIDEQIGEKMRILFKDISKTSSEQGLDLKDSAFLLAILKLSEKL